jgi:glucan 1,3-beta-glucosidase
MAFIRSTLLSMIIVWATIVDSSPSQPQSEFGVTKRASTYWYENIAHQGIAPFAPSGYQVYRNVKNFGAVGMLNVLAGICVHAH